MRRISFDEQHTHTHTHDYSDKFFCTERECGRKEEKKSMITLEVAERHKIFGASEVCGNVVRMRGDGTQGNMGTGFAEIPR
jgi:hypothetical protein